MPNASYVRVSARCFVRSLSRARDCTRSARLCPWQRGWSLLLFSSSDCSHATTCAGGRSTRACLSIGICLVLPARSYRASNQIWTTVISGCVSPRPTTSCPRVQLTPWRASVLGLSAIWLYLLHFISAVSTYRARVTSKRVFRRMGAPSKPSFTHIPVSTRWA